MENNYITIERDITGARSLFYCEYNGEFYHSESVGELIKKSGITPKLDAESIAEIALIGPGRSMGSAVFAGISELPAGHRLIYKNGAISIEEYWKPQAKEHTENLEETAAHVKELIVSSIEENLEGTPCAFLSGGLDSSIIAAVASKALAEKGEKLVSYSVDYRDNDANFKAGTFQPTEDAPYIKEVADFLGIENRRVILDTEDLYNSLFDAVKARGLPAMADVDGALYLFCKEAAKDYKTALSGECADEFFSGYRWFHDEEAMFKRGFPWVPCVEERYNLLREGVLGGINPAEYVDASYEAIIENASVLESDDELTRKRREMFCLNYYGFMQTLMERNGKMASANLIDVRTPFCSPEIIEYAYNIPWEIKAYNGREKGILRRAFADMLPENAAWRKKSPFPKTYNPDYMKKVSEGLSAVLAKSDCRITEIYDKNKLLELIQSEGASFSKNWYGQLMTVPQIFAYLIQLEYWLREFNAVIEK